MRMADTATGAAIASRRSPGSRAGAVAVRQGRWTCPSAEDEEVSALQERAGHGGEDPGESRAGGDHREGSGGTAVGAGPFVEVLDGDSGSDLVGLCGHDAGPTQLAWTSHRDRCSHQTDTPGLHRIPALGTAVAGRRAGGTHLRCVLGPRLAGLPQGIRGVLGLVVVATLAGGGPSHGRQQVIARAGVPSGGDWRNLPPWSGWLPWSSSPSWDSGTPSSSPAPDSNPAVRC